MKAEELKAKYDEWCNAYLRTFCENYELEYDADAWVGRDCGTVAMVGDYYFGFETIRYCVDNGLSDFDELLEWYDYGLYVHDLGLPNPNFKSWHEGCPHLSEKEIRHLVKLKSDYFKAVREARLKIKGDDYSEREEDDWID